MTRPARQLAAWPRRGLVALAAAGCLALAPAAVAAAAPVAAAPTTAPPQPATATVVGTVTDGTTGKPVAELPVRAATFRGTSEVAARTARTGADGTVSFTGLAAGAEQSHQLSAAYLGTTYHSDPFTLTTGERKPVALAVYRTTTSPEEITIDSWVVWVDPLPNGVAIEQDIGVTNGARTAYAGATELGGATDAAGGSGPAAGAGTAGDPRREVLRLPLAPGAGQFQFIGFLGDPAAVTRGDAFIHTTPLPPGESQGALRYETASLQRLSFAVALPVSQFTLLAPAEVTIDSAALTASGEHADGGVTYRVYSATGLRPGSGIDVAVTLAAPAGTAWRGPALVAGALALLVAGVALALRLRRGQPPAAAAPAAEPAAAPVSSAPDGGPPADPPGDPDGGVEAVLDRIALLDLAYERGALDDETTYRRRREALLERARTMWPEPTAPPESAVAPPESATAPPGGDRQ